MRFVNGGFRAKTKKINTALSRLDRSLRVFVLHRWPSVAAGFFRYRLPVAAFQCHSYKDYRTASNPLNKQYVVAKSRANSGASHALLSKLYPLVVLSKSFIRCDY